MPIGIVDDLDGARQARGGHPARARDRHGAEGASRQPRAPSSRPSQAGMSGGRARYPPACRIWLAATSGARRITSARATIEKGYGRRPAGAGTFAPLETVPHRAAFRKDGRASSHLHHRPFDAEPRGVRGFSAARRCPPRRRHPQRAPLPHQSPVQSGHAAGRARGPSARPRPPPRAWRPAQARPGDRPGDQRLLEHPQLPQLCGLCAVR